MKIKSLVKLGVLLLPSVFLLAACSNGNSETSSTPVETSNTPTEASTSTPTTVPAPQKFNVSFYLIYA